jgi:hypothetical protein
VSFGHALFLETNPMPFDDKDFFDLHLDARLEKLKSELLLQIIASERAQRAWIWGVYALIFGNYALIVASYFIRR